MAVRALIVLYTWMLVLCYPSYCNAISQLQQEKLLEKYMNWTANMVLIHDNKYRIDVEETQSTEFTFKLMDSCTDSNDISYNCDLSKQYCDISTNSCGNCSKLCDVELINQYASREERCKTLCIVYIGYQAIELDLMRKITTVTATETSFNDSTTDNLTQCQAWNQSPFVTAAYILLVIGMTIIVIILAWKLHSSRKDNDNCLINLTRQRAQSTANERQHDFQQQRNTAAGYEFSSPVSPQQTARETSAFSNNTNCHQQFHGQPSSSQPQDRFGGEVPTTPDQGQPSPYARNLNTNEMLTSDIRQVVNDNQMNEMNESGHRDNDDSLDTVIATDGSHNNPSNKTDERTPCLKQYTGESSC